VSRIGKFMALPPGDQWLFLQAWCVLGWYRFSISCRSLRRITANLQQLPGKLPASSASDEELARARRVSDAIARAAVATPWSSRCLVQVLSLRHMLAVRGIGGQFYIGANLDADAVNNLSAHAWLQCGHEVINGGLTADKYPVLPTYRW
jgi:transglutaminase superfamily protein